MWLSFFLRFSKYILLIHYNCVLQTLPFPIAYAGTINLRHPINKHGQDSGDLTNKLTKRPPSSHLRSTYSFAYLNTISMHAKQENPKLINPPALSPAYSFRQNFIFHIFFSSFSMKPNDGSLLLSHCLNSHRDYHSIFFSFRILITIY